MTLAQMQARFFELKGKLAVGQIQEEEFKRELEKLRFQDIQGRWWMLGAQSGRWYYYNGARWLLGDPPEPPPPVLSSGEPGVVYPAPVTPRNSSYYEQSASSDPAQDSGMTISVPYSYAPAQPAPTRNVSPQNPNPSQPASTGSGQAPPPNGNGQNYAPSNYAPSNNSPAPDVQPPVRGEPAPTQPPQTTHSLGQQLHDELGKVGMLGLRGKPTVQGPQLHRPELHAPDLHLHAPDIHIPPQFIPHTPAPIRKYQPPFILIGAVVIGLALVALMWLAVDNFVPGKPISTLVSRTLGNNPAPPKNATRAPTLVAGQNINKFIQVGDDLTTKSQFEPAIEQYQAAAKYAPNEADVYTHWARALSLTGRIGEAIAMAQKATRLDPTSANAYAELTRALAWAGQTDQAVNAGEKAVSLDAQNATAQAFLAEAYLRAGRTNDAQTTVDKALELDDASPETHRAAGWVAILSGRKDEGVGEWNRVIELAPDLFLYHYEFGLVYANHLNDPASAIPAFQDAIRLYAPYIPSYTALGRAYLASNQPGPAILEFQKALTLDPNSSDSFLGLGQAFALSSKCQQAIPYFQKALELNKKLSDATKGLEDCGAIAKGSAPPQAVPTQEGLAPVATAIPQATVAPLAGSGVAPTQDAPLANPASGGGDPGPGRLYFALFDGQYHLYSSNPDGSDRRLVVELASAPSVSSDGSKLLFYSWVGDQRGIHRINTNGSGDIHISLRAEDTLPSWSPDGARYVYATRAGLGGDINKRAYSLRVSSTATKPRQDPNSILDQAQYPSWGPNDRIVFRDCGFPTDTCGLAIANSDGSNKKALTNINSTAPAWSPDGNRIVFMSNAAGNWDLYTISPEGGSPERLTDDLGDDGLPAWSPDGKKIAFVTYRGGRWSMWSIAPNGDNEVKLFDLGGELAGNVPQNSPAQPGQVWTEQRLAWR